MKTAGDEFHGRFPPTRRLLAGRAGHPEGLRRNRDPRLSVGPLWVRIGCLFRRMVTRDGDYFGRNIAIAARVAACAEGGEYRPAPLSATLFDEHACLPAQGRRSRVEELPNHHVLSHVDQQQAEE